MSEKLDTDILVVGGGLGGVAAALAALEAGRNVVLVEQYEWLGGQLTSQGVPVDEHPWIEEFGATQRYRRLRQGIRDYYRRHFPLTDRARSQPFLTPGAGSVSKLCSEPRVGVAVIEAMLAPWLSAGKLRLLKPAVAFAADVDGDRVQAVRVRRLGDASELVVAAKYVVDATETGELLPLTGTEYVTGFESQEETGEPSAPLVAEPDNWQALSVCFAVDHVDGDHTIDKPAQYDHWRAVRPHFWGGPQLGLTSPNPRTLEPAPREFVPNGDDDPLAVVADQSKAPGDLNLWVYRRLAARKLFTPGFYSSDITLVNWPSIDYFEAPVVDVAPEVAESRLEDARQLSLSMLYWLQTEAPNADGGAGLRGLRLRPDVMGTVDGLAQAPYIRESRRIRALTTVTENDVSMAIRGDRGARKFADSVGIGMYRIDLHPSTGGDNYIDVPSCPFQIPLGALIPQRMRNLLAGNKNIGTTHITNGCYRLHPVEWNIGEAAGALAATCIDEGVTPHQLHEQTNRVADFQRSLESQGVELDWPAGVTGY
ncbi:FAD-dependent oxidoreductase [Ruania zhangjianzhongii]|uniref:FAD-dependent oxidoreductase n=1 Tax=Ruania zhangjianzhongii TaxID=2603206 RepID=UPI0011D1C208|nr:FAD-dependent oxidoreductase [Ruania zhangjianzhongii]